MIMGGSFNLTFLLVGLFGGMWLQQKYKLGDIINTTWKTEPIEIKEDGEWPGPNTPSAVLGAATFNEVVGALWPDVAKTLEATLATPEPVEVGGGYSLHIKNLGLGSLQAKFSELKCVRPLYIHPEEAQVIGKVTIWGVPESHISLTSPNSYQPNVETSINSIKLSGNLHCRLDCKVWRVSLWLDETLKSDIQLALDVSVFPMAMSWVANFFVNSLQNLNERSPFIYDCVEWEPEEDEDQAKENAEDSEAAAKSPGENIDTSISPPTVVNGKVYGVLTISNLRAEGLPAMDMLSKSSDPYLKVKYLGMKLKTAVKKSTLTPKWDEKFQLIVKKQYQPIRFEIWDHDANSKNDFMCWSEKMVYSMTDELGPGTHTHTLFLCNQGKLTFDTTWCPDVHKKPEETAAAADEKTQTEVSA